MPIVSDDKNPTNTFSHYVYYMFVAVVGCYVVANIWIVESCKAKYLENEPDSGCAVAEAFTPLRHVIPAIYRPMEYLQEHGNVVRAKLVGAVYGFAWGSFLTSAVLLILGFVAFSMPAVRARLLSDAEMSVLAGWDKKISSNKSRVKLLPIGKQVVVFGLLSLFFLTYWEYFSFDQYSFTQNIVHTRNRDLYYLNLFLFFIVFFFGVIALHWFLRRVARRSKTKL